MTQFFFAKVPPIYFGAGKLQKLPSLAQELGGKIILLVTGSKSLKTTGKLAIVQSLLEKAGLEHHQIACGSEPTTSYIDRICDRFREHQINLVVGIGGGSAIDAGKAISAMLPHNNSILDHLEGVGKGIPHSGIKVPFIAIPTSSGTGGEVTKNAVISEVGPDGYKKSLRHNNLIPDAVIVDSELLLSCPRAVTAACGMDAFTQLLEPYLSPIASPMTDALAWSGIEAVVANLLASCGAGAQDLRVREGMAYGSLISGIALANAGLGIVHGLASPIGGFFPIPHGVVCGTLMAASIKANWAALREREPQNPAIAKMAKLGELLCDELGHTQAYYCEALVEILENWTNQLKIPLLSEYGIQSKDFERIISKTRNRNNPIELTPHEIRNLLESRL